jgi:hypothetical protein
MHRWCRTIIYPLFMGFLGGRGTIEVQKAVFEGILGLKKGFQ